MSGASDRISKTAAMLRREFDRSFAEAVTSAAGQFEDVLTVRIGGDPFVLRLSEVAGLHVDRTIVSVPSPVPELLGIAGIRGVLTPVYDLGALLGYPVSTSCHWFVLARAANALGLAVESFEAHVRLPREAFAQSDASTAGRDHAKGAVQLEGVVRPIIHMASVLEAIARRARTVEGAGSHG